MTGLADALAQDGQQIEVFADHIHSGGLAELMRPYPIRRFGSIRPLRRARKRGAIARAMAERGVSGLFADSWKSIAAIPPSAAPIAVLAHGTEFPPNASPARTRRINAALGRARVVIANSRYTATLIEPFLRGTRAQMVVINPPIAELPTAEPLALAKIDAAIAGRGPVLTTLARLEPRKGVDAVLRALPALRATHAGLVYLVAGAGDDLGRLRKLAAQLGVEDCVVFLGEVVDIGKKAALLTRTDVYAMPSRRVGASVEGFGISYVEAAWYGASSLAGGDGGANEAVVDEQTGLLCDGSDDAAVRVALSRLLDDGALRAKLGSAAAAHARAFTWRAALPRYLAALSG